jgi:hypothetical protein
MRRGGGDGFLYCHEQQHLNPCCFPPTLPHTQALNFLMLVISLSCGWRLSINWIANLDGGIIKGFTNEKV